MPLAAQSREEPEPYSLPASMTSGDALLLVAHRGVVDRHLLAVEPSEVARDAPSVAAAPSWLRRRMLANVPRIITSWLPRREP